MPSLEQRLRTFTDGDDSRSLRVEASLRIAELEAALNSVVGAWSSITIQGRDPMVPAIEAAETALRKSK